MTRFSPRIVLAVLGALLCALALAPAWPASAVAASPAASARTAPAPDCSGQYLIDKKFANGARWQLCWDFHSPSGLRILNARYTPKGGGAIKVLRDIALGQVHVPYDFGDEFMDMPLSWEEMVPITKKDCPGGELRTHNRRTVVCATTLNRGYGFKSYQSDPVKDRLRQAQELSVFGVFEISWYNYVVEYRFTDDGEISPRLGATGSLAPEDADGYTKPQHGWPVGPGNTKHAANHSHNAFWRVDFDLQGQAGDRVEQFDFAGTGTVKRTIERKALTRETSATLSPMRFWRVVDPGVTNADRHPISWQIGDVHSTQYRGSAVQKFTHADVFVTQYDKCELLAADNAGRCGKSVDKFVNGQAATDPVVWVSVDFHHVPRDEDQDPMPTHWQGFTISPRDVTAVNPYGTR